MKVVSSFETSGSAYPVTHPHSPEKWNPHQYYRLNGRTEGIRQFGISETGREGNIKIDLKEAGCGMHRIHLAHDKDQLRALANTNECLSRMNGLSGRLSQSN